MSYVSFSKIQGKDEKSIAKSIMDALNLIEFSFPSEVKNIVIKPNLCYYWDYSTGETTDPMFIQALVNVLREKIVPNPNIMIVETDASAMKCRHAFKILGYERLAKDCSVHLVNLSEDRADIAKVTVGKQSYRLKVPRTIRNADLRINVSKMKYTSRKTKITCALKNVFGCLPYTKKFRFHSRIEEVVLAANKAMKFDLFIIDGNIVSGVQPRRLGLVMASKDPVAIDVAAAKILGLSPKLRHFRMASAEGLGTSSFISRGIPLNYFKARYPRQNAKARLMDLAYKLVIKLRIGKRLGLE
jgi:uncharacterized protein (DUF362 family)